MADMYLYNGVKLPALPENDYSADPYVFIIRSCEDNHYEVRFVEAITRTDETRIGHQRHRYIYDYYPGTSSDWELTADGIGYATVYFVEVENRSRYDLIWSNWDIYHSETGEVYMAASDPVPVGAVTVKLDPKSLLAGWLMGRAIAGQKTKRTPVSSIIYPTISGDEYVYYLEDIRVVDVNIKEV